MNNHKKKTPSQENREREKEGKKETGRIENQVYDTDR